MGDVVTFPGAHGAAADPAEGPGPFDVLGPLPTGRLALEASAGTGKTWTIAALVTRWIAEEGVPVDELLVVTFTRAATAELRDRVRRRLVEAHDHLDAVVRGGDAAHPDPVAAHLAAADVALRRDRLARALAGFDAATITTIHGFCHQVLAAAGFRGQVAGSGTLVEDVDDLAIALAHDQVVGSWVDVPAAEQDGRPGLDRVLAGARAAVRDGHLPLRPDPDGPDEADDPERVEIARIAQRVRLLVEEHKARRGLLTYDDLLLGLLRSLDDPVAGPGLRTAMRRRHRVALVDEFQDTDPVQWAILRSLFDDRPLVLIGDPKQAIYRFRGADVAAYLDAVGDPATELRTLDRNHRSDPRLVAAVNGLFDDTTFGDERIRHHHVRPAVPRGRLHFPDGLRPCLEVRVVEGGHRPAEVARGLIARDLAAQVAAMLSSGATIDRADDFDDDADDTDHDGRRPIRAADCAVLVRTNQQAADVQEALRVVGIPAVVNGVGSVLDSEAAADWHRLLAALERPASAQRVRALALSPVVGRPPAELLDEVAVEQVHDAVHRWARVLDEHGLATLVRTVQRETRMPARMLGQQGGERWLADFEHVAELLQGVQGPESHGPAALLGWMGRQQARSDELPTEQRARRIASDALAVQVLTIHRSKGLQFPVVFCPYVMTAGMSPQPPLRHRDPERGDVVHLGGTADEKQAKEAVKQEEAGELLRLLYVAFTRAEHHLVTWWFPLHLHQHSPFSRLLLCDGAGPRVAVGLPSPHKAKHGPPPEAFDAAIDRVHAVASVRAPDVEGGPTDLACWHPMDPDVEPQRVDAGPRVVPDLVARRFTGRIDGSWRRSSYTALTSHQRTAPDGGVVAGWDEALVVDDEPELPSLDGPADAGAPAADAHLPLPLGEQPGGAAFGTLAHHLLEHVDFAAPDLPDAIGAVRRSHRHGVALPDPDGLDAGLAAAVRTPLGPAFGGLALADVRRRDRLDELAFELPLAHGDGRVTLGAIGALLAEHLGTEDPFGAYGQRLAEAAGRRPVHGWLTGSIDLVLRRRDADGRATFHVLDHKTNRLHAHGTAGSTAAYDHAALVGAMQHGDYVVQALLYQVALHRYLRWRLPAHDPARDLGAVGYLFLRGMVGPQTPPGRDDGTPCGVLAWEPPVALVLALGDLLDRGGAA